MYLLLSYLIQQTMLQYKNERVDFYILWGYLKLMKVFYALIVMLTLSLGFAPLGMAHEMMPDCAKTMTSASHHDEAQAQTAASDMPCDECPSEGKAPSKDTCCASSMCASMGFLGNGQSVSAGRVASTRVASNLTSVYASVEPSGPQKPPRIS